VVSLGETNPIPASVFADNDDVRLRVWFSQTGTGGSFELLTPDRRITSTGYALSAGTARSVGDGLVTTYEDGAVVIGDSGEAPLMPLVISDDASLAEGIDLALEGDIAFLAGDRLRVYDVADPTAVRGLNSTFAMPDPTAIAAQGDFAYMIDGTSLQAFEFTPPFSITPRDTIVLGGYTGATTREDVLVKGDTAYVLQATPVGGTIERINVVLPDILGSYGTIAFLNAVAMTIDGDRLYAVHNTFPFDRELRIYDISDDTQVVQQMGTIEFSGIGDVAASGDILCVSSGPGLGVYDVSDPDDIIFRGNTSFGFNVARLAIDGDSVYGLDPMGGRVRRIDISDPTAPVVSGTINGLDGATQIRAEGGAVYVTRSSPVTPAFSVFTPQLARASIEGNIHITGALVDTAGAAGGSGQVLTSSGSATEWTDLLDNDPTNELQTLSVGGSTLQISDGNSVDLGALAASIPDGAITANKITAPGEGLVLVSDGAGGAQWMSADNYLLAQGYTPSLPGIVENLCKLEVSGVFTSNSDGDVQIINGPGFSIEDLGGTPSESGLNAEFQIVFDYPASGSGAASLQAWHDSPSNRECSILVGDQVGSEIFRWNLSEMQLTDIAVGGGNDGKNRYTMSNTFAPDNLLHFQRTPKGWNTNEDRREGDTKVEIEGVQTGGWPKVAHDPTSKTLKMTFDYNEGGDVFEWAERTAELGTFNLGRKSINLIYEDNSGTEIGRNSFYECFPVSYQHFTGFDLNTKCREQIVISYETAENAANSSLPLYAPPPVEYVVGTPLLQVPYDPVTNGLDLEIEGISLDEADDWVLTSGPGLEIERVAGFDGSGNPDDSSGGNKEYPLVFETGGASLNALEEWRQNYYDNLPILAERRSLSLIVNDGSGDEQYRWNGFEMVPYEIFPLPSGRSRVTLYHHAPGNLAAIGYNFSDSEGNWGDALMNNPATDSEVEILGITTVFAEVAVDTVERTITLTYSGGEGGKIFPWAKLIASDGTGGNKKSVEIGGNNGTNYFGCFPIAFQCFTGFAQDNKIRARAVLSYDTAAPANQ